jgi:transcriptional regulator with XRE-family HTH domain
MDSVGSRLREARTRRKIGLQEVEAATKIRAGYLQAIENEDWEQLPGDVYVRAFIRTYARFVGLDGDRLAEEHRRSSGAERPGERLPRVEPHSRRVGRKRGRWPKLPPRLVAVVVSALVIVALLVIGLSSGGGSGGTAGKAHSQPAHGVNQKSQGTTAAPSGHQLELVAKGEVWVCLLDAKQKALVDGVILAPGEAEGPFRSGSFTLALGNGAMTMIVDGKRQQLPQPASPIGFAVGSRGTVHELPEGDRPTCT